MLIGLGVVLYVVGVHRLHRRGDRWPVGRTISWFVGLAIAHLRHRGARRAYGRVQFSAHMIAHMTFSMVIPMFLVLGAPITLALRCLPARRDGSRGAREWLLAIVESRYLRFLTHPVVVCVNFGVSLVFFYYSNLFPLALTTHVGHELMHVHFLFAGYLLAWVMIGVDPGPNRPLLPAAPGALFVTLVVPLVLRDLADVEHDGAGSGVSSAASAAPGAARCWTTSGSVAGSRGASATCPTLALVLILAIQWTRSDDREARRRDRAADRDGDAELMAYNAMLSQLADVDARLTGDAAAEPEPGRKDAAEPRPGATPGGPGR